MAQKDKKSNSGCTKISLGLVLTATGAILSIIALTTPLGDMTGTIGTFAAAGILGMLLVGLFLIIF